MHDFLELAFRFYGLDWLTMLLGLTGTYFMSIQDRRGFACNGAACATAATVAVMSGQPGFIVYNVLLIAMMVRGFRSWKKG